MNCVTSAEVNRSGEFQFENEPRNRSGEFRFENEPRNSWESKSPGGWVDDWEIAADDAFPYCQILPSRNGITEIDLRAPRTREPRTRHWFMDMPHGGFIDFRDLDALPDVLELLNRHTRFERRSVIDGVDLCLSFPQRLLYFGLILSVVAHDSHLHLGFSNSNVNLGIREIPYIIELIRAGRLLG